MNDQRVKTRTSAETPAGTLRLPISCYIRTLNEERCITDVIHAAFQVASEVIVVDSGSSDGTLALARAAGARVIQQPWLGNGKQKRVGEDAARHDWLLDLDADEIVSAELAAEIRELFQNTPPHKMYALKLVTVPPFGEPWWGFKLSHRIKLYNKQHIRMPEHAAWDQFEPPLQETIGRLHAPLLHHAFTGVEHVITKLNRASSTRARETKLKSLPMVILRVLFAFPFYFFKEFVLRGLFRGGLYGFVFACSLAFGRWLKDVKMYERHRKANADASGQSAKRVASRPPS
jgi:glycosyltransferase involved in cell wall biosynthesis